ncbi:MAG: HEAT repeat domain-containing protein [Acidimicrobiia bacterium]|nr:HEAT repeat domain-containing protein [Acidimicrobiia bacterium]
MDETQHEFSSLIEAVEFNLSDVAPDTPSDAEVDPEEALDLQEEIDFGQGASALNALASAWSTFRLYPDPANQPAFTQALGILAELEPPIFLQVRAGSFAVGVHEIEARRGGVEQLAKQLFLHDVDEVRIEFVPTADDLCEIFRALSLEPDEAWQQGGLLEIVSDIATVTLRHRGLLGDRDGDVGGSKDDVAANQRDSELAAMVDDGTNPTVMAEYLKQSAQDDPAAVTRLFIEAYEEIHQEVPEGGGASSDITLVEMFSPYWAGELGPSPTGTFMDVFFMLPHESQVLIMAQFLDSAGDGVHRIFLDQFSGAELADLASHMDQARRKAMLAYARDAGDVHDVTTEELLALLESGSNVRDRRQTASTHVAELLATLDSETNDTALAQEIREQVDVSRRSDHASDVMRGLFEVENREERFKRLLRVWTGHIAREVRKGDYPSALKALETVTVDPPYDATNEPSVQAAVGRLVSRSLVRDVLSEMGKGNEEATAFLIGIGSTSIKKLVEQLAEEEDGTMRRALIDLLTVIGKRNVAALMASLRDPRWYVVRNVATVLGKTGNRAAVAPLTKALSHEDARVRIEVLRALMPLAPNESARMLVDALADREKRVRHAAAALIKTSPAPELDAMLIEGMEAGAMDDDTVAGVADALVERGSEVGLQGLRVLADRKFALKKHQRAVRNAARAALEEAAA